MGCCGQSNASEKINTETSDLLVLFLFLDEKVCQPFSGTAKALDEAIEITSAPLAAMGVKLKVEKAQVVDRQ